MVLRLGRTRFIDCRRFGHRHAYDQRFSMTARVYRNQTTSLAAGIASAYVSSNSLPANELVPLIVSVHMCLAKLSGSDGAHRQTSRHPAVPVDDSIHDDHLVCLEDGKKFKTLRRHLNETHGLTPDEYRRRWDLPFDYPMMSPNYAAERSEFSRSRGLGYNRRRYRKADASLEKAKRNETSPNQQ